jgi:hypothetical protein
VGLGDPHHDVDADLGALVGGHQHRVGLADAGIGPEEDLQVAAAFLLGLFEKGIGCRTVLVFSHSSSRSTARWCASRR